MKAQFFVNIRKQWELSRIQHDTDLGIDPVSAISNPASVFLTEILSPPLIYVLVALILLIIFLVLVCVFKEDMKPCLFSMLDVLSYIGLICFNILVYIFSWVKAIAYPVKELIFKITDKETCFCCCCFRFKNPIFTGERSGKEVAWGRRGQAPSRADFGVGHLTFAEQRGEGLHAHTIENVNFYVDTPWIDHGPRFHNQEREDRLRKKHQERLEQLAAPDVATARAATGNDDHDDGIVDAAFREGTELAKETGQELGAMGQGATKFVTGGMATMQRGATSLV